MECRRCKRGLETIRTTLCKQCKKVSRLKINGILLMPALALIIWIITITVTLLSTLIIDLPLPEYWEDV